MSRKHTKVAKDFVAKIKTIKITNTFTDDHILCADVMIDGTKVQFYYCGWEIISALKYFDHPKAKPEVIQYIANQIECNCDIVLDLRACLENGNTTKADYKRSTKNELQFLELVGITTDADILKYAPAEGY